MTDPGDVPRSFPLRLHEVRTLFPVSFSNGPACLLSGRRITYQEQDVRWIPKLESPHCLGSFSNDSAIVNSLLLPDYFVVLGYFVQHGRFPAKGKLPILQTELG